MRIKVTVMVQISDLEKLQQNYMKAVVSFAQAVFLFRSSTDIDANFVFSQTFMGNTNTFQHRF